MPCCRNGGFRAVEQPRWPRKTDHPATAKGISRRALLTSVAPLGILGLAAACGSDTSSARNANTPDRPLALIYRGPAAFKGCAEAVARLLQTAPTPFRTVYCGPDEQMQLSASALETESLYAQPGGGDDLDLAWVAMRPHAGAIRNWIRGGHYIGFCMGGFLAGFNPGYEILPKDSSEYITSPGATVRTIGDPLVTIRWRGRDRRIYFQGGPYFSLPKNSTATVLATYTNGLAAAIVARFGLGSVGVTGPHPEAPASWYREADLKNPDGVHLDLGYDLVETTMKM